MAEHFTSKLKYQFGAFQQLAKRTALLMVGIPDYENYLAHMQSHHPELAIMSRADFIKRAQEGRYAGKKLNKCPC